VKEEKEGGGGGGGEDFSVYCNCQQEIYNPTKLVCRSMNKPV
jgi:hypothetical protein